MRPALLLGLALALAGCLTPEQSSPPTPTPTPTPSGGNATALVVASPAFEDGADIPREHTCDGADTSPPLAFANLPANATALALIVYDPDAPIPQAPQRNITHWLAWNIPVANASAAFNASEVPNGTRQGANENGANAYMGPCPPPVSSAHRYVFWAFALDAPLDLEEGATRAELQDALAGHVLAEGTLTGMYARAVAPG